MNGEMEMSAAFEQASLGEKLYELLSTTATVESWTDLTAGTSEAWTDLSASAVESWTDVTLIRRYHLSVC